MREIRPSGLKRAEAAGNSAPPLLYFKAFTDLLRLSTSDQTEPRHVSIARRSVDSLC